LIKADKQIWPYIESKPLHGSQKFIKQKDSEIIIELNLQVNHEFMALLFSYMDTIEVLGPISIRKKFKNISETIFKKHS
jgi:hypothetical protein